MELNLITYGCGYSFDIGKFNTIKNESRYSNKPTGGLWASPINSKYGWRQWGKENDFGDFSSTFRVSYKGKTIIVDSVDDLSYLTRRKDVSPDSRRFISYLNADFEHLASEGIDAIYLTQKGEKETRFTNPGLYGWDCESVIIMNPESLK
jgi:hypothetical protein